MNRTPTPARRPLLLSRQPEHREALLSIAAVAGVEVDVAVSVQAAGASWRSAPLVLVADDGEVSPVGADRRSEVLLVSWDLDDADVWRRAHVVGAENVVMLPDGRPWLVNRLADAAESASTGLTIAVVGARGGAGASAVAAALALRGSASGRRAVLIDTDADSAGLDLVLGAEDVEGVRWSDLALVEGRISGGSLLDALPRHHELRFLSCTRDQEGAVPSESLDAVVASLRRVQDLVVIDLQRHDRRLVAAALLHADLLLMVVPAEVRAVAAASRFLASTPLHGTSLLTVVRLPGGGELSPEAVAEVVGARLIGSVKDDARAAVALDRGDGPDLGTRGPWRAACDAVLDSVQPVRSVAS